MREVTPKAVRAHVIGAAAQMASVQSFRFLRDGTYTMNPTRYFANQGASWVDVTRQKTSRYSALFVPFAVSRVASIPGEWSVSLGYAGWPSLRLPTDPEGAREAFRLRDLPNGKSRRAALRHWVSEHWRKSRTSLEDAHKVREHLRGATEFVWNGLRCTITPSQFDLERAAQ